MVLGLLLVGLVLIIGSLLTGIQRENVFDRERSAAADTDKAVWMNQGDRNPHSAAHFSRYAFRPATPLAIIDPGTSDFAGLAIWMEAHYQDPAIFRRAEDNGELSRYLQLTPAFLLLTLAPLLVFLMTFSSIAGEREDGTLRQLLATGVTAREFFRGKIVAALRISLTVFVAVFVPIAIVSLLMSSGLVTTDAWLRVAAMFLAYSAYTAICVAIGVSVSAMCQSRQTAFLSLAVTWAVLMIFVPRIATDVATGIHPQPDARDVAARLSAASDTYYRDMDRRNQIEQDVLAEYGAESVDELPINYGAYLLQVSEELSEPEFEALYGELDSRYADQERTAKWFSLVTPRIAIGSLSRGLAGADRVHQRAFAQDAEMHRREMIKLLNEDYMYNAGVSGASYTANENLWAEFSDFDGQPPAIGSVIGSYSGDIAWLVLWLLASVGGSAFLVTRAVRGEVAAT
jgi:ABC-2 type transport system permease protein